MVMKFTGVLIETEGFSFRKMPSEIENTLCWHVFCVVSYFAGFGRGFPSMFLIFLGELFTGIISWGSISYGFYNEAREKIRIPSRVLVKWNK